MSLWLEVFCQNRLGQIAPEAMLAGIGKRLSVLTNVYCPDAEEELDRVLKRMKIRQDPNAKKVLFLHARQEAEKFIRIEYGPVSPEDEVVQEKVERLASLPNQTHPDLKRVRDFLKASQEAAAFQLMFSDMTSMGLPVAVAGAAWIAEIGNGIMRNDQGEWMLPTAHEVCYIYAEQGRPPQQAR
jgi:hypothetical protein